MNDNLATVLRSSTLPFGAQITRASRTVSPVRQRRAVQAAYPTCTPRRALTIGRTSRKREEHSLACLFPSHSSFRPSRLWLRGSFWLGSGRGVCDVSPTSMLVHSTIRLRFPSSLRLGGRLRQRGPR